MTFVCNILRYIFSSEVVSVLICKLLVGHQVSLLFAFIFEKVKALNILLPLVSVVVVKTMKKSNISKRVVGPSTTF